MITVKDLNYSWGENPIVTDFSSTIQGDKIGVVLERIGQVHPAQLLLKQLEPD